LSYDNGENEDDKLKAAKETTISVLHTLINLIHSVTILWITLHFKLKFGLLQKIKPACGVFEMTTAAAATTKLRHLPVMRKVSANARHRTTDVVISSADRASSWRWGDIGGVVTVGDGGDVELAAAGAAEASAETSAGAGADDTSASPLAAADAGCL